MKRIFRIILAAVLIAVVASCGTETFHSGTVTLEGTIVKYLVSENDLSLEVSAEGIIPDVPIYVKLMTVHSSTFTEDLVDSVRVIPHKHTVPLKKGYNYNLFLEKGGKTIGIGQFSL